MKRILSLIILVAFQLCAFAQAEGVIHYQEIVKLDVDLSGIPEAMREMIPKSQIFEKELLFDSNRSLYKSMKGDGPEDMNMESGEGSVMIKFSQDDTEDILYTSLKDNLVVHQKGIMGKAFIVESEVKNHSWKLTNEKIKYLDFECQKAIIENEDKFVVAWYTSQIPSQVGPKSYSGLPGAILMLSIDDGAYEIKATKVDLSALGNDMISIPNNGKKVTKEEYEKISEEKIKEMKEMYKGGAIRNEK